MGVSIKADRQCFRSYQVGHLCGPLSGWLGRHYYGENKKCELYLLGTGCYQHSVAGSLGVKPLEGLHMLIKDSCFPQPVMRSTKIDFSPGFVKVNSFWS